MVGICEGCDNRCSAMSNAYRWISCDIMDVVQYVKVIGDIIDVVQ